MKRCPQCQNIYTDDSLRFCLQDGKALIEHRQFDPDAETLKLSGEASQSSTSGLRAMIRIEIEENLAKLTLFSEAVNKRVNFQTGSPIALMQRSDGLRLEPLPSFSRGYWERTPTPNIAEALTTDEIQSVHEFYSALDQLTSLRANKEEYARRSEWRRAFEPILERLLERGNPVK